MIVTNCDLEILENKNYFYAIWHATKVTFFEKTEWPIMLIKH